jgi:hypothetical protein
MGGSYDAGTEVVALAFLDLRFPDGHVERWLGPGRIGRLPAEPDGMAALQSWAGDTANEFNVGSRTTGGTAVPKTDRSGASAWEKPRRASGSSHLEATWLRGTVWRG